MEALDMVAIGNDANDVRAGRECRVGQLLSAPLPNLVASIRVCELTADSRCVMPGWLFIAMPGLTVDGRQYIDDAIRAGASAVFEQGDSDAPVGVEAGLAVRMQHDVPVITVPALAQHLSSIAARFYRHPASNMRMIGITGTNGKTSCAHMVARAAAQLANRCGVMGTLGVGVPADERPLTETGFTTPNAIEVQRSLAALVDDACRMVAIEVSSHALVQHRVEAVPFDIAVLTNISRDHLDFHRDMRAYAEAKSRLFYFDSVRTAIVNVGDELGRELAATLEQASAASVVRYALDNPAADLYATDVEYSLGGIRAMVHTPNGTGRLSLAMMGSFNLSNALASLAVLLAAGFDLQPALKALGRVAPVAGRMQVIKSNKMTVLIDFAHTPDALQQVLQSLRAHTSGKVICVFGCGGDRDRGKRAEMGRVARRVADRIVLTSDNPRSEPAAQIIDDILLGITDMSGVSIEPDRAAAIALALHGAVRGDVVLIAGKGHERYQEIAGVRHPFFDADVVKDIVAEGEQC